MPRKPAGQLGRLLERKPMMRMVVLRRSVDLLVEASGRKNHGTEVPPIVEPGGEHPDDFMRLTVDADGATDDVMPAAKTVLPATLVENHDAIVSRHNFPWKEVAAKLRCNPEHGEEIRGDAKSADHLGRLAWFGKAGVAQGIAADLAVS